MSLFPKQGIEPDATDNQITANDTSGGKLMKIMRTAIWYNILRNGKYLNPLFHSATQKSFAINADKIRVAMRKNLVNVYVTDHHEYLDPPLH